MFKRPSLILVEKTRRAVYRSKPREAVLGDGTGNIYAPDGKYYCRWPGPADENGNATFSAPFSAFGGGKNFIVQDSRRVYIVQNHKGQLEIDGAVYEDLQSAGIKPSVMNPNEPRRQFTRFDDMQNFKAIPIKGTMKVRVGELFYVDRDGIPQWFPGTVAAATATNPAVHVNLTSSIPATDDYECFALISFNQDEWALGNNPFEVSVSTAQLSIPSTLGIADIQEAYAGMSDYALPVKAFRLRQGITNLDDVNDRKKDLDGRQLINIPQASGGASPLTTKGDLYTYSTLDARLPVGTDGQILYADSAETTGLRWDDAPSSGYVWTAADLDANEEAILNGDVVTFEGDDGLEAEVASGDRVIYRILPTGVAAGTYAYPAEVVVNAQGQIEDITAGSDPAPPFVDTTAIVKGSADATKLLRFEVDGFTTATTRVLTAPNFDGTIATLAGTEALSNKAITNSTIDNTPIGATTRAGGFFSAIRLYLGGFWAQFTHANTGNHIYTLPDATTTLVGTNIVQAITLKTIDNSAIGATTPAAGTFSTLSAKIGGFLGTFTHANTADRNYTFPDASTVIVGNDTTQTLTNKTLTTPTIADFTNAQHDHLDADDGGQLTGAAVNVTAHNAVIGNGASGLTSLAPGANRNVMISDGTDWTSRALALADVPNLIAILRDEKTSGTNGGTSANTTWNARDLNTKLYDPGSIVSISSNQFTPIAGDYAIEVFTPFFGGSAAASTGRCRLYNVTGAAVVEEGMSAYAVVNGYGLSVLQCKFTANGTDAYRIDTYTSVGKATNGLGPQVGDGSPEVYTCILLRKIA